MKRRVMSLIISLALCLSLCPTWALDSSQNVTMKSDMSGPSYNITYPMRFNVGGYTYTVPDDTAFRVQSGGSLELMNGTVKSGNKAGVEVEDGGSLCVEDPGVTVIGTTYGLDISSGADVKLSGGTFTGETAAVLAQDYGALLVTGYAFFDENGGPLQLEAVSGQKTLTVEKCTNHMYSYEPTSGAPTHSWTCLACGTMGTEPCTFSFDENYHAECGSCGHTLEITVNPAEAVYDGTDKPANDPVTVTLDGSETLTKNTDYTVNYDPRTDVGEITITVAGNAWTCKTTFSVTKATPVIEWENTASVSVLYDGDPVEETDLPEVIITAPKSEDLEQLLYFSYKKDGDAGFTKGLPTDAGTYEIKASLPETPNHHAASSGPISLTITKNDSIEEPPAATNPTYNGTAQELITSGKVRVGAEIQFAVSEGGPWSTDIPTGTNAGGYVVWYRVVESNNYNVVEPTQIPNVTIERKPITPDVKLSYYTCVYDGGYKQPSVTVSDTDDWTVLPTIEYEVEYKNNQNVGTAAVTVTDKEKGNYAITTVETLFQITAADQAALTITNQPNTVSYGDVFTLGTSGGSGNGTVTWEITVGKDVATIGQTSGQVTVKALGSFTVQAKKSGTDSSGDNHAAATAQVTFTAGPKHVVATVTADSKTYDGTDKAEIHADVKQGVAPGDQIEITGLTGTFSDANVGTNKAVAVNIDNAEITIPKDAAENEKYTVAIPAAPVRADITRAETSIDTPPVGSSRTYDGTEQPLVSAAAASTSTDVTATVEYALRESGPYSTVIPTATNAGSYEVWYRARETDNYFGTAAEKVDVMIARKSVTAVVTLEQSYNYVYDGTEKKPAVTVKYTEGTEEKEIPSTEYTVAYSDNINAGTNAAVTVTARADGNYIFQNGPVTKNFEITQGSKAVLTSSPQARDLTYNGQEQDLVTVGTAAGGHLEYSVNKDSDYDTKIPQKKNAGTYTVYYMVKGDDNHGDSDVYSVSVTIKPKTVTSPVITLEDESEDGTYRVTYTGGKLEPKVVHVMDGETDITAIEPAEYTVTYSNNINAGTATVHISDNNGGNYNVSGSKTFEITKAAAKFTISPAAQPGLTYKAAAQALITAGVAEGGTAVYSLGDINGPYSTAIPTGIDRGAYEVWAKVLGDMNHENSEPQKIENVEIAVNNVGTVTVELSSASFRYNGSEQKPTVTIKDDDGYVIPVNEYTVTYRGEDNAPANTVDVGHYYVVVTSKGINYSFIEKSEKIEILPADQTPLTITGKPNVVYYGDTIQLGTTGGSGNGTVEWSIVTGASEGYIKKGQSEGQFIITGVGSIKIKAVRTSANYETAEDTWAFYAEKKPVTAVVTAKDRDYNGSKDAELTVTVLGAVLADSNVTGTFDSADVGANKTVTINSDSAKKEDDHYKITYPATTTASITPANVAVTDDDKPKKTNPTYNGSLLDLVTAGAALDGGSWAYSVDGVNYSLSIPKAASAGAYSVWYKVLADSNHRDSAPVGPLDVTIAAKPVIPTVKCSPETFPYDGTQKTPNVTVTYNENGEKVIPASEYTVEFPEPRIAVKNDYTVTVTSNGNYRFDQDATGTFSIIAANQAPLTIVTDKAPIVYYGDTFRLSVIGGSGDGEIKWDIEAEKDDTGNVVTTPYTIASIDNGVVSVKGIGSFTVTAQRLADGGHSASNTANVSFVAEKKPVTAVVTAKDRPYEKDNVAATVTATVPVPGITINGVTGTFDNADVGTNKTVTIEHSSASAAGANSDKYEITYPATTTASITPAPTTLPENVVTKATGLTYNGEPQALVTVVGTTPVNGGDLAYSLDGTNYSLNIPTCTGAGTYTVWYKVRGDSNHMDSEAKSVTVTIGKAAPNIVTDPIASPINSDQQLKASELTGGKAICNGVEVPGTFTWADGSVTLAAGRNQCEVTFTPYDRTNYTTATTTVDVTVIQSSSSTSSQDSGPSTPETNESSTQSVSPQTSVREDGTARAVLTAKDGNELVSAAVAKGSENVIIKPEITDDVTKMEVSIPATAVSRIGNETNAALTVSTPIADVTIPNAALDTLSSAGDAISVVTERVENTVVLTLTADNKDVGEIPGGLTLTVSVENAGPGTVAMLVHKDGTRETVRWSVAKDDAVRIPLNGSVTVEIIDNSKEFGDVPAESWAADAVAFASAHELFNGTGETTFSPELSMSRAMLATVLYNLEGRPDQNPAGEFSDVGSGAWYVSSVSWATAYGIAGGYGNGRFGPDDNVTREQFAVMLWRYAGSHAADEQPLNFTDADQVSSYAMEALCWASANGILNGYGDGRINPDGLATRAQAAQMLKNFMENT